MIRHIVLFNVKEGEDKDQAAAIASRVLEPLVGQIPGLLRICIKPIEVDAGADCHQNSRSHHILLPSFHEIASIHFIFNTVM